MLSVPPDDFTSLWPVPPAGIITYDFDKDMMTSMLEFIFEVTYIRRNFERRVKELENKPVMYP